MMFVNDIKTFVEKTQKTTSQTLERAGSDLVQSVLFGNESYMVNGTPVDTGRARANWNASIGVAQTGYDEKGFDETAATTLMSGLMVVREWAKAPKKTFHFTNTVPYIEELEDRKSLQAPDGIANITVADIASKIDKGFYK